MPAFNSGLETKQMPPMVILTAKNSPQPADAPRNAASGGLAAFPVSQLPAA